RQGLISEAEFDAAVTRLFAARMRLGMFDPPERVRWARIPASVNQAPAHDALALKAAQESLVLLKNDGVLPLSRELKRIAVVGPTADDTMALLGNYFGTPAAPVTVLQGIRDAAKGIEVRYARGVDLVEGRDDPGATPLIEAAFLRPSADSPERGLRGEYFRTPDLSGTPALVRTDAQIGFRWDRGSPTDNLLARGEAAPGQGIPSDGFSIRWSGQLLPPVTGRYRIEAAADDGFRLYVDGKRVLDRWTNNDRLHADGVELDLQAGQAYDVTLEYYDAERDAAVRLGWRMPGAKPPFEAALDAARDADVVVFVGGLTGDVEGEEMTVNYPGFAGGDRTDLRLPATQRALLEALQATGKPVVLVLTGGSALAVDWAQQNLPAILMSWYPGQRGGTAVGQALFGDVNPGGRLPVTFYKAEQAMPAFDDYTMEGRTYRYFRGTPLYPFGHGLSYTRFDYQKLRVDARRIPADGRLNVQVEVANIGKVAGDEVVQLYVRRMQAEVGDSQQELRGFQRVHLAPGERRTLTFELEAQQALRSYDDDRGAYAVPAGRYEVRVGGSSADARVHRRFKVEAVRD
ncbi:MAG: glycoside hydrolase family 3 C-terminal domain-containing protein, partial [Stenotrophomonas sp.]